MRRLAGLGAADVAGKGSIRIDVERQLGAHQLVTGRGQRSGESLHLRRNRTIVAALDRVYPPGHLDSLGLRSLRWLAERSWIRGRRLGFCPELLRPAPDFPVKRLQFDLRELG